MCNPIADDVLFLYGFCGTLKVELEFVLRTNRICYQEKSVLVISLVLVKVNSINIRQTRFCSIQSVTQRSEDESQLQVKLLSSYGTDI